jgi:hypothetical protein
LIRLLDGERAPFQEPLRDLEFYRNILEQGCRYCRTDLISSVTGISLDRLTAGKHVALTPNGKPGVVGCCGLCNRLRGSGPDGKSENDRNRGFSMEEMIEEIGPAVARVRARREKK